MGLRPGGEYNDLMMVGHSDVDIQSVVSKGYICACINDHLTFYCVNSFPTTPHQQACTLLMRRYLIYDPNTYKYRRFNSFFRRLRTVQVSLRKPSACPCTKHSAGHTTIPYPERN
jgi:hypothetical protein